MNYEKSVRQYKIYLILSNKLLISLADFGVID